MAIKMDFIKTEEKESGSVVSRREKGKSFSLINKGRKDVSVFQVDGGLICDGSKKRCDYLFEANAIAKAFYVELKGCNIEDAITQLKATLAYREMIDRHNDKTRVCHVVANRVPKSGPSLQVLKKKFLSETKVQLFVNTRQHSEEI
ncbi:hypothetical protein GCM10022421_29950 [Oceanisphaera sediminis]|uniref:tRNA nuclease CdiA C-terminal domain-containing protein n=1 Tax=Oceanisphaera sediminis TaxID=981381 RepID=A0ABP7EK20_9GAMM